MTVFLTVGPKAAGLAVLLRIARPLSSADGRRRPSSAGAERRRRPDHVRRQPGRACARRASSGCWPIRRSPIRAIFSSPSSPATPRASVFYLVAYLFMNAGAFGVLAAAAGTGIEHTTLADLAGLGRRAPVARGEPRRLPSLPRRLPADGRLPGQVLPSSAAAVREGHVALAVAAVLASLVSVGLLPEGHRGHVHAGRRWPQWPSKGRSGPGPGPVPVPVRRPPAGALAGESPGPHPPGLVRGRSSPVPASSFTRAPCPSSRGCPPRTRPRPGRPPRSG
ncbi:MAG: hypothetical protein MZV70_66585 [Desulfobacterales bacterium]|nr:hypothetical protein [Desulfobacterales bacterium]